MALQRTTAGQERGTALTGAEVAVIRCEGELGELELAHLCDELFRLSGRGCRRVVIDLAGVDHVDYRGVGPLAARARALREAGGDLKVSGLSPYVAAIFRAAGVEHEFELHRTVSEAKAAFVDLSALVSLARRQA